MAGSDEWLAPTKTTLTQTTIQRRCTKLLSYQLVNGRASARSPQALNLPAFSRLLFSLLGHPTDFSAGAALALGSKARGVAGKVRDKWMRRASYVAEWLGQVMLLTILRL